MAAIKSPPWVIHTVTYAIAPTRARGRSSSARWWALTWKCLRSALHYTRTRSTGSPTGASAAGRLQQLLLTKPFQFQESELEVGPSLVVCTLSHTYVHTPTPPPLGSLYTRACSTLIDCYNVKYHLASHVMTARFPSHFFAYFCVHCRAEQMTGMQGQRGADRQTNRQTDRQTDIRDLQFHPTWNILHSHMPMI